MKPLLLRRFLCLAVSWLLSIDAFAGESLLKEGDVVAFVGGEEMVAMAEDGSLEGELVKRWPAGRLVFRSFAWEGDSAFEQHRDLNYPALAAQLASSHATVVLIDFGKMESLAGVERLPAFRAAYQRLLEGLAAEGRRLILLLPHDFSAPSVAGVADLTSHNADVQAYSAAIRLLGQQLGLLVLAPMLSMQSAVTPLSRDGIHLNATGRELLAQALAGQLLPKEEVGSLSGKRNGSEKLLQLIQEKNRLWFNYYRPQNWAFLAGDRTNQPSSRDHLDPQKRWFPAEMEQYLPLIKEKEERIQAAASQLGNPNVLLSPAP